jgi:hypothetical protein
LINYNKSKYNHILAVKVDWSEKMAENKFKEKNMAIPIENHNTAAWSNIEKTKPVSNVTIPSEVQVRNAKEYVDTNEK